MTEADLIRTALERGGSVGPSAAETMAKSESANALAKDLVRGHAQTHTPGRMNKTEAAYAAHLDLLKTGGDILCWKFEAVKLRLADKTWYTPDFMVIRKTGRVEMHEVKGFWRDDARVKFKVAQETFQEFWFVSATGVKGQWILTPSTRA